VTWSESLQLVGAAALALALALPAQLNFGEPTHLHAMLTSLSLHGLPGMAAGLVLNRAMLTRETIRVGLLFRNQVSVSEARSRLWWVCA
jgi:hypothetical protein